MKTDFTRQEFFVCTFGPRKSENKNKKYFHFLWIFKKFFSWKNVFKHAREKILGFQFWVSFYNR